MARPVSSLIAASTLLVCSTAAYAEPANVRAVGIARTADRLVVSVGLQDLFRPADVERIMSGFSTRVLLRVALVREGEREPVARAMRLSEIVYDVWDEKIRVRHSTDIPGKEDVHDVATARAAVEAATTLVDFTVTAADKMQPGARYRLSVRADLNPVSEELVTNVRRWLSRPIRGRSGTGDTFFGSFVSVFVNPRVDDSERQLQIVSPPFDLPKGSGS